MVDQLDTQTLDQLVEGYPRMKKCSSLAADCKELDSMHALMDLEHWELALCSNEYKQCI